MDRSPSTPPTPDRQSSSWPEAREAAASASVRGARPNASALNPAAGPSRLGQAIRRFLPTAGPAIGAEPVLSTGGGGFRSGSRPEPPLRGGDAGGPARGNQPQLGGSGGGGPRMPRGGGPQGPRPERYWTDYLRIALPIIGLILMLSLFIFWVGSIINSNGDSDQTPTAIVALQTSTAVPSSDAAGQVTATVAPAQSAAASQTQGGDANASPGGDTASSEPTTAPAEEATQPPAEEATETPTDESADAQPTDEPASDAEFAADDQVVVNNDDVNIRDSASTGGAQVATVSTGDALTIVSGPETADDYDWYEVTTEDGTDGWIASDYLDPA